MANKKIVQKVRPAERSGAVLVRGWRIVHSIATEQRYFPLIALLLLLFEVALTTTIIRLVPYTEIDWTAYMEQVASVINGERDYANIRGGTGPIVYPAGHVYIYSALYWLTDHGTNILRAQFIFAGLYVAMLSVVFAIFYQTEKIPPWLLVFVCLTKRIHSIFVLRLFNDCFAMFFLYLSIYLFLKSRWYIGSFVFSLAVSVKMNILLFAPPLLILLLKNRGWAGSINLLSICAILQIVLGLPFLMGNWWSYVACSFNLGRQFLYVWTVNMKYLPEDIFLSKELAIGLLVGHVSVLLSFATKKWCTSDEGGFFGVITRWRVPYYKTLSNDHIVVLLFTGNFIGIIFARSLHFQFYIWYFHSIPYLLWSTSLPVKARMLIWGTIEFIWNIFPSNSSSSFALTCCHALLILALWFSPNVPTNTTITKKR